jgi:hypothetical protein
MADLGALVNLREVFLDNTQVSDAGLESLKGLTYLERLRTYPSRRDP